MSAPDDDTGPAADRAPDPVTAPDAAPGAGHAHGAAPRQSGPAPASGSAPASTPSMRRRGLLGAAAGLGGTAAAGFVPLVRAAPGAGSAAPDGAPASDRQAERYRPRWCTAAEWAFLRAATDRLIPPGDGGPGAVEAGVPVFIDLQLTTPWGAGAEWYMQGPHRADAPLQMGWQVPETPAQLYRMAIAAIDAACQRSDGRPFAELPAERQDELLKQLQQGKLFEPEPQARQFFSLLLENTKEGYFADPMYGGNRNMAAWKMIGFPGARAAYLDWAELSDRPFPLGPVSINGQRG